MTNEKAPTASRGQITTTTTIIATPDKLALPLGGVSLAAAQLPGTGTLTTDACTANWLEHLTRTHISTEVCADLAKQNFPELALELMRLRGDIR